MKLTRKKLNKFLMFKLPSAYLCGVRLSNLLNNSATVTVRHRWINQNPFKSMYFAVQSMAAELSTGALVIAKIMESNQKISMLVTNHQGSFSKKATGKITFTCEDGHLIDAAIEKTIETGEGQTFVMHSLGKNEQNETVSTYQFEWSIKLKSK
ncbi:DUF4442 domain-containing protein [Lutibacter sp. TH_r2]|uniref:DUF4442 domain-containing protein n=1 Tax=Lutibacter sp. TH_r2 TaxID=3082083 RepID=UPI0029531279|nr:DUF4442 domain-containing protein [Lutibacter sp. TH_r2]MDV7185717.1 DUF4442 domain-containing protein [Lutibacter sp. TH_r2]